MIKRKKTAGLIILFFLLLFSGCERPEADKTGTTCQVVLEEGDGFEASSYICRAEKGQDASFDILMDPGYEITRIEPEEARVLEEDGFIRLILPENRYTRTVRIEASPAGNGIWYHANGGEVLDASASGEKVLRYSSARKRRGNTENGRDLFVREGYTLTGWNTCPDGSGEAAGLGSRIEFRPDLILYAQWKKWSPQTDFLFEKVGDGVRITGYTGDAKEVTVPGSLYGERVSVIGEDAFRGCGMKKVILPDTIREVEKGAFADSDLEEILLFDNLTAFSDYAVEGCGLRTLRINAALPPVYSGNYFASFSDKYDRLLALRDRKKIVLFSGSSTRFGYDSAAIDEAFDGYEVVNMGVFAYTNAVPQLLLILDCMGEGDILIHSPEFDAAKRQFCTSNRVDDEFFAMCEGDYDRIIELDLREVEGTFSALTEYLGNRRGMKPSSYLESPSDYDEDGNRISGESYNEYGDYILYRENASEDTPIYGLPVEYTAEAYPKDAFIRPLNEMYERFREKGVKVFFTCAPRNKLAVSENSTVQERERLDEWFRQQLTVPVLGTVEESLVSGIYLYGTDNHLSTEGVRLRTQRIIRELKEALDS